MSTMNGALRTVPALVLGLLLLLLAAPASAHTELEAATFGPGDVLTAPPADLTLSFASVLVPQGTQVVVRDADGSDHVASTSTSGQLVRVQLRPFDTAGGYVVDYRAVAGDGHPITGSYEVEVTPAAAAAARATDSAPPAPNDDDPEAAALASSTTTATTVAPTALTWTIGALGAGGLALLLLAGARRRPDAATAVRS